MPKKTLNTARRRGRSDTDTATYEQPQGSAKAGGAAKRRVARMPHERDESAKATGNRMNDAFPASERQISQAHQDIEAGQVDTDRRGIRNDVPSSGRNRRK